MSSTTAYRESGGLVGKRVRNKNSGNISKCVAEYTDNKGREFVIVRHFYTPRNCFKGEWLKSSCQVIGEDKRGGVEDAK